MYIQITYCINFKIKSNETNKPTILIPKNGVGNEGTSRRFQAILFLFEKACIGLICTCRQHPVKQATTVSNDGGPKWNNW